MEGWQTQLLADPSIEAATQIKLTILLPAFNEELAIGRVLAEVVDALAEIELPSEIVVVDDASTDRTVEVAEQFATDCWQCPIRVVRCPENRGAGAARKVGVRQARGEIVLMLDA